MKITSITTQKRDSGRVNVSVDGKYRFSLDAYQVIELGVKIGREYDESDLTVLEQESQFGKIYSRALEYSLMRPHSSKEIQNYLYKKTRPMRSKGGELRLGVPTEIIDRVFQRLLEKKYVNDNKFAKFWVENHSVGKGISRRKLTAELRLKGINDSIISQVFSETNRNDLEEIFKVIAKKRSRYSDDKKLIEYLVRSGFAYDDIKQALKELE